MTGFILQEFFFVPLQITGPFFSPVAFTILTPPRQPRDNRLAMPRRRLW